MVKIEKNMQGQNKTKLYMVKKQQNYAKSK